MSIDIGVGTSWQADVYVAGQEAARQVIEHLGGTTPHLTLVFAAMRFADPRLLGGIRSVIGDSPLVGCTDAGGICTSGPVRRSVTVIGLKSQGGHFVPILSERISHDSRKSGHALAKQLTRHSGEAKALLLFPDGLSGNVAQIVEGIQDVLGYTIPVVGGAAADDLFFQRTFQFFNDQILTDSVPAVLFCGDMSIGIGVRHGWMPIGTARHVTRSNGRIVYELDHQPAVSIYEDFLGVKTEQLIEEPLGRLAITYPLGCFNPAQGDYIVRDAFRVGEQGSLVCASNICSGAEVRLMIGGQEAALEAARQAAYEAATQMRGSRLRGALLFCSVAHQRMLGSESPGEIDVVRDALGGQGVRMGGFYTYGEQAPMHTGMPSLFHNESIVVMAMG